VTAYTPHIKEQTTIRTKSISLLLSTRLDSLRYRMLVAEKTRCCCRLMVYKHPVRGESSVWTGLSSGWPKFKIPIFRSFIPPQTRRIACQVSSTSA